jgi:hypothetical protein
VRLVESSLLSVAAAILCATPAWSAPVHAAIAAAPTTSVPAATPAEGHFSSDLMFPYLAYYWSLPPEKRSMFVPSYTIATDGQSLAGLQFFLKVGDMLKPIDVGADGHIEQLPSAEDLKGHPDVVVRTSTVQPAKFQLSTTIATHPLIEPALEIDAAKCALAIEQVNGAIPKPARMMGLAPTIKAIGFKDATSGVAVLNNGRTVQLPLSQFGAPMYDPKKIPGARLIRLDRVPTQIIMI